MLTDAALRNLKPKSKIYKASDRDGMYVTVSPSGTVTFRYDYRLNGRRETLTLGRYGPGGISLSVARELLLDARKAVLKGISRALEKQCEKRWVWSPRPSARRWRRGWRRRRAWHPAADFVLILTLLVSKNRCKLLFGRVSLTATKPNVLFTRDELAHRLHVDCLGYGTARCHFLGAALGLNQCARTSVARQLEIEFVSACEQHALSRVID